MPLVADFNQELEWAIQTIRSQSAIIRSFFALKEECERSFLFGQHDQLAITLDAIEETYGISLWLIEARINAMQAASGFRIQKEYAHTILSDPNTSPLFRYIISWLSFRSEENVSATDFQKLVDNSVNTEGGFGTLVRVILGDHSAITLDDAAAAITYCDALPPIDRYFYLITILQALVSNDLLPESLRTIAESLSILYADISDPHLRRLIIASGGSVNYAPSDELLIPALDAYTAGDLKTANALLEPIIDERASVGALVLAIRAGIQSGSGYVPAGAADVPIVRIAKDLSELLLGGPTAAEAEARLTKLRLTNGSTAWAADLEVALLRIRHDERYTDATSRHTYAALRASNENPALAFCFKNYGAAEHYLSASFPDNQGSATIALLQSLISNAPIPALPKPAPQSRLNRVLAMQALRQGDASLACAIMERTLTLTITPLEELESQILLSEAYLRAGLLDKCAEICVAKIIQSRYLANRMPIARLVSALIEREQEGDRGDLVLGRFHTVIILDMYSRYIDNHHDAERADAFNDLILAKEVKQPSDLQRIEREVSRDEMIYFLHYVCVPEILDQCYTIKSTNDVENERVRAIVGCSDLYAETGTPLPIELQDELQEIRTRQVVRDTNLKLDQSKIFVDIDGIQAHLGTAMRDNWNRYRLLGLQDTTVNLGDLTKALEDALGRKLSIVNISLPVTELNKLFVRMVREIRDQFSTSKLFGLDANLSTNIRHGYILRELRGPFLNYHLVTNLATQEGAYQPNRHWLERLDSSDPARISDFSNCLDQFSLAIDSQIERLTRQIIRIRSEHNDEGLFDFSIDDVDIQLLQQDADKKDSYDSFLKLIFDYLWQRTEYSLELVRDHLRTTTLKDFNSNLTSLQADADRLLSPQDSSSIRQAITLTRPEINSAVDRVVSWFTLSATREYQDFPLKIAFDAGLATVRSYFSDLLMLPTMSGADTIVMQGWTLPHFARLFSMLIENCALHSGIIEGELRISTEATLRGDILEIRLCNQLADSRNNENLAEVVRRLNRDFGTEAAADYIRVERGSGFPKIWKILRHDLHRDHALQISITENAEFCVDIMLDKEGIVAS